LAIAHVMLKLPWWQSLTIWTVNSTHNAYIRNSISHILIIVFLRVLRFFHPVHLDTPFMTSLGTAEANWKQRVARRAQAAPIWTVFFDGPLRSVAMQQVPINIGGTDSIYVWSILLGLSFREYPQKKWVIDSIKWPWVICRVSRCWFGGRNMSKSCRGVHLELS
jgi:hypothetical protein